MGAGPIFFCGSTREKIGRGSCYVSFKKPLKGKKLKIEDIQRAQLGDEPIFFCHIDREPTDAQIKRWERELKRKKK